jgi:hypothetical protein
MVLDLEARSVGSPVPAEGAALSWPTVMAGRQWPAATAHLAWTDARQSRTISAEPANIDCPADAGIEDFSQVNAIYVFLDGRTVHIDDVRAE